MASAFALAIFSGIGFLFGIQKSLRAFLNPLFTSRVVTENGICSAAFCESAALWAASSPLRRLRASSPKGRASGKAAHFAIESKTFPKAAKSSPFGGAGKTVRF